MVVSSRSRVELLRRELERCTGQRRLVPRDVQAQLRDLERVLGRRLRGLGVGLAQDGPDAGDDLAR